MIGTEVSHYRIESEIGRGGMGVVYKAQDTKLGRTVALKFLPPSMHADKSAEERFVHEAKSISALDHPNIAVVHEIGEAAGGQLFIAMGYYTGETLEDIIARGPLDIDQAVDFATQLASGLQCAHEKGITHRDIKPGNVIVTESGLLKILDFGLAKVEDVTMTAMNVSVGTPAYLSPEQSKGLPFDHRVDLWALGVVMYEMLVGSRPFDGGYASALAYAVVHEIPESVHVLRPDVPEAVSAVVDRLLQKDPDKRYQKAADVVKALENRSMVTVEIDAATDIQADAAGPGMTTSFLNPTQLVSTTKTVIAKAPKKIAGFTKQVAYNVAVALTVIALGYIAQHFFLSGRGEEAEIEPVPMNIRDDARLSLEAGLKYLGNGQYDLALAELEQSVAKDSMYSPAWSSMAAAYQQLRDYDAAIAASNRALAIDSTNDGAYYNLGFALSSKGRIDEAIAAFSDATRINAGFTRAYSAWGDLLNEQNRPTEALEVLERALAAPIEAEYRFLIYKNIGKAYIALGQYGDAIDNLEPALNLRPDWPETNWLLARSYEEEGRIDEAKDRYEKYIGLENDPTLRKQGRERLEQL